VKLEPKENARCCVPEETAQKLKPQVYAAQEAQDRKEKLVLELKDQVDALRAARDKLQAQAREPEAKGEPERRAA
jgi:hypothetical protein